MDFVRVSSLDDLWSGEMRAFEVQGVPILVIRKDNEVFAYEDRCAHLGLRLSCGSLVGDVLTCPGHLWQFDACTGKGINPADSHLRAVPVKVSGNDVLVAVGGEP